MLTIIALKLLSHVTTLLSLGLHPSMWVPVAPYLAVKPGRESDHSDPSNVMLRKPGPILSIVQTFPWRPSLESRQRSRDSDWPDDQGVGVLVPVE
jgi:hypothetical protein